MMGPFTAVRSESEPSIAVVDVRFYVGSTHFTGQACRGGEPAPKLLVKTAHRRGCRRRVPI
jgi:hypothetical protein